MYDTDRMAIDFVQQFSGQAFTVGQQVSTFTSYFIKKKKTKKKLDICFIRCRFKCKTRIRKCFWPL